MLQVSPESNLDFRRPFNQVVRQTITLTNTASDGTLLAFKIKTTAPKQYCVRPNAGTIPAGASREVEVLLQAMKEDPAPDFKCKDKFLVQSIAVPPEVATLDQDTLASRLSDLWIAADEKKKSGADPEAVIERKLKCNFVAASSPITDEKDRPPVPTVSVSGEGVSRAPTAYMPATSNTTSSPVSDRELRDAKDAIKRLTAACEGYKSEIERLNVLRQRKQTAGDDKSGAIGASTSLATSPQPSTLPLPLALVLAIIAFILGAIIF
ncbi:hypothetical protein CcCBS67573_g08579 [Chytriomyces confervae]|uniref:MSP domain-containing protein n=1 Tax=Chytriomyces confervae TaxID=246404 RepID=A0A507EJ09_9FUNG|nr:hypothetical protein CcCBS67573_g08579 [Chytriomyces confervae]